MAEALTDDRFETPDLRNTWKGWLIIAGLSTILGAIVFVVTVKGPDSILLRNADTLGMRKPTAILAFANPLMLQDHFNSIGYDLDAVRLGKTSVPRVLLARVPDGLADMRRIDRRKRVFISLMLPLVLEANERVLRQRVRILLYQAKLATGRALSATQKKDLDAIAAVYGVSPDRIDRLLSRVDAVPPSLALAQAAIESGWGTSRFVREGNAPFGQWTTADQPGIVPSARKEGKTHKIRSFDRLIDSVHSYLSNLNTHRAYGDFRARRAEMRNSARPLDGYGLVPGLRAYSERGGEYLTLLRQVIRTNALGALDDARLRDTSADGKSGA
jgi:Bax protein